MRVWTEWAASQLEAWILVSQGFLEEATGNRWGPSRNCFVLGTPTFCLMTTGGFFGGRCVELANRIEPGYR